MIVDPSASGSGKEALGEHQTCLWKSAQLTHPLKPNQSLEDLVHPLSNRITIYKII